MVENLETVSAQSSTITITGSGTTWRDRQYLAASAAQTIPNRKVALGRTRVQEELFDVGTEGHVLARFGLDPGNGGLLVATAE